MRDALTALQGWRAEGRVCALATVVRTWSSAPRPVGSAMAVSDDGQIAGSVSGGCVEAAVRDVALQVASDGAAVLVSYGVSDEDAFAVGLTCGGTITVLVSPVTADDTWVDELAGALQARTCVTLVTDLADDVLGSRRLQLADVVAEPDETHMVQRFMPPARILVYGANDFARAITETGHLLGDEVVVCDARAVFATQQRFPHADGVVVDWPHRHLAAEIAAGRVDGRTAICALSHDAKFDLPLLELALRSPAGYVGALGSRRTCAERVDRLRDAGLSAAELGRLHSPIGLDLGGRTPAEVALSVVAEIVAVRHGARAQSLRSGSGAIHA